MHPYPANDYFIDLRMNEQVSAFHKINRFLSCCGHYSSDLAGYPEQPGHVLCPQTLAVKPSVQCCESYSVKMQNAHVALV